VPEIEEEETPEVPEIGEEETAEETAEEQNSGLLFHHSKLLISF